MNVKRFTARTSRDSLALVRQTFGDEAVVLSTRPCPEGVEMLAMGWDSVRQLDKLVPRDPAPTATRAPAASPAPQEATPSTNGPTPHAQDVQRDVDNLQMSTLSFQHYVRERMLARRRDEALAQPVEPLAASPTHPTHVEAAAPSTKTEPAMPNTVKSMIIQPTVMPYVPSSAWPQDLRRAPTALPLASPIARQPVAQVQQPALPSFARHPSSEDAVMGALQTMQRQIEARLDGLAYMEKLQRDPRQARLTQRLLDVGFSPTLVRAWSAQLPADLSDEMAWMARVIEQAIPTDEHDTLLEDQCGAVALVGPAGSGKTSAALKLAAAALARHGAQQVGLISLDAWRGGAQETLRATARAWGVPVHTAQDQASLDDLLALWAGRRMVIIDTAGVSHRDGRQHELMTMLASRDIKKVLVVNATSQGDAIEESLTAYRASEAHGVIVTRLDEATRVAPVLDTVIRHALKVVGVGTGQGVPEDWQHWRAIDWSLRALNAPTGLPWQLELDEVGLRMGLGGRDA